VNVEEAAALLGSLSPEWTAFVLRLLQALLLAPSQLQSDELLQYLQNDVLKSFENTQRMALLALFEDPQLLASLVAMLAEPRQPRVASVPSAVRIQAHDEHEQSSSLSEDGSFSNFAFKIQRRSTAASQASSNHSQRPTIPATVANEPRDEGSSTTDYGGD
jgi:hypothetical protein